jgi:hypothetical protein
MTILTSISPTNIDNQKRAINTWLNLGYKVISINSKNDIVLLKSYFNVEFLETNQIGNEFGKDYVRVNAFTNWIKNNESALIINSDIEINKSFEIEPKKCQITIFTRNDYTSTYSDSKSFISGFDAFFLTPEFCKEIPNSRLCLGQCHWDYFIPLLAIRNCYQLNSPKKSHLYHKIHKLQYDNNKWLKTAKIFAKELNLTGNPHTDSAMAFKRIKREIKYY